MSPLSKKVRDIMTPNPTRIAAHLGAQRQVTFLTGSVESAARAVELAEFQYREGAVDYTRVLNTQ